MRWRCGARRGRAHSNLPLLAALGRPSSCLRDVTRLAKGTHNTPLMAARAAGWPGPSPEVPERGRQEAQGARPGEARWAWERSGAAGNGGARRSARPGGKVGGKIRQVQPSWAAQRVSEWPSGQWKVLARVARPDWLAGWLACRAEFEWRAGDNEARRHWREIQIASGVAGPKWTGRGATTSR